jgi:hypothetical protein
MDEEAAALLKRIMAAQHAIQSAVAYEMTRPDRQRATEPKHLRVGINSAMVECAALGKLLIDKGIITEREYLTAMAEAYEAEQRSYEERHAPLKFG